MTLSVGSHVRAICCWVRSSLTGPAPSTHGMWPAMSMSAASSAAWRRRSAGTSAWSSGSRRTPVSGSSMRSSRRRAMRKLDGTMPLALPLCTPSRRMSTRNVPAAMPRSEVVIQMRS